MTCKKDRKKRGDSQRKKGEFLSLSIYINICLGVCFSLTHLSFQFLNLWWLGCCSAHYKTPARSEWWRTTRKGNGRCAVHGGGSGVTKVHAFFKCEYVCVSISLSVSFRTRAPSFTAPSPSLLSLSLSLSLSLPVYLSSAAKKKKAQKARLKTKSLDRVSPHAYVMSYIEYHDSAWLL